MMNALRFGIEIETIGLDRSRLAQAIQAVVAGTIQTVVAGTQVRMPDGRVWSVVPDGSLSGYANGEIVSPILTHDDIPTLQEIVRAVRRAGARVDASCGIHIHVDGSGFDAKAVTNLVKMVHKQERLIEKALGIQPGRLQRFCQPIDATFLHRLESRGPRTMHELRDAWYGQTGASASRYHQSRYHGLNLNSLFFRGTIEFRLFEGTLHAGEVKAYVQFVLALAAKALRAKSARSSRRDSRPDATKYEFRVFLLSLGMIGPEFKTARLHLTKRLAGSTAWRGARRDGAARSGTTPAQG